MARTTGAKGAQHDARRAALLEKLRARLAEGDGALPSMRELAAAAGVSVPTITHYFGRREAVVEAVLAATRTEGAPHLARAAAPQGDFAASMAALAADVVEGHRQGLGDVHVIGLREGLRRESGGPAYLTHILEPTLAAVEARLAAHQATGDMRAGDARAAALAFVAPLVLAALHQQALGGAAMRPLDLDNFARSHAEAFVRGWAP